MSEKIVPIVETLEPTMNLRFEERIIRPMFGDIRIERVLQQEWIVGERSEWMDIPTLRFKEPAP
mgnify:CR=1 FL=1|jgi:hypothetical protein